MLTRSRETLSTNILAFIEETGIEELMVASHIFDLDAKLKSFSILRVASSVNLKF